MARDVFTGFDHLRCSGEHSARCGVESGFEWIKERIGSEGLKAESADYFFKKLD